MNSSDGNKTQEEAIVLPQGYRGGLVTAITLFLGFSITFLRFWSFEASGEWTPASIGSAIVTGAGIALQFIALFRALDIRDEAPARYRATVRIFFAGVATATIGALLSSIVFSIEGG